MFAAGVGLGLTVGGGGAHARRNGRTDGGRETGASTLNPQALSLLRRDNSGVRAVNRGSGRDPGSGLERDSGSADRRRSVSRRERGRTSRLPGEFRQQDLVTKVAGALATHHLRWA